MITMKNIFRTYNSSSATLIFVLIAYSILIPTSHHYERLTGDATLYLSIAEKYISGDFNNAINGYWGPLLSWLLIPFLYFGSTHLFAINSLNLVFGLLTITGVWRLSYRFEINENLRSIILVPLVPILLYISLIQPMDFLLLCILVYYLNVVFRQDYPDRLSYAALSGFLGALAYFSKPYGFPFFIAHFLLINTCHYLSNSSKEHRINVLRNVLVGFIVFSLLSGVWIALISKKYDRFTFSNMGSGVMASLGPESLHKTLEKGDPIFFEGFFAPPNDTAFVIYEDPSYARKKSWNPLGSRKALKHYLSNITENFFEGLRILEFFSRLSAAIIIAYMLLIFAQPPGKLFSRRDILYPFLTVILYAGGYAPFHLETRYLWIINILLLLMGAKVLNELLQNNFMKNNRMKSILILLFILSFVISPVKASIETDRNNMNREMYIFGKELSERYDIQGNIASNRQQVLTSTHDSWHKTFRLAYWLKSRYYGQAREHISDRDLERELKMNKIDYYFFWGDPDRAPQFLNKFTEITKGEIPGLKIFLINE